MRTQLKISSVLLLCLFTLSACAGQPITLGVEQSELNLSKIDFSKGREITSSASGFQLLLLIPIQINNRHDRAYQSLRNQARGQYITDIKIQESWVYGFVGNVYTTTIKAKAYPIMRSNDNEVSQLSVPKNKLKLYKSPTKRQLTSPAQTGFSINKHGTIAPRR